MGRTSVRPTDRPTERTVIIRINWCRRTAGQRSARRPRIRAAWVNDTALVGIAEHSLHVNVVPAEPGVAHGLLDAHGPTRQVTRRTIHAQCITRPANRSGVSQPRPSRESRVPSGDFHVLTVRCDRVLDFDRTRDSLVLLDECWRR